jgi:hypothetical protein
MARRHHTPGRKKRARQVAARAGAAANRRSHPKSRRNPGVSDSGMAFLLLGALGLGIYFWTRGTPPTNGWMI